MPKPTPTMPAPGAERAWHGLEAALALGDLQSDPHGLTQAEADRRMAEYGPNELHVVSATPAWKVFLAQFKSPLIVVLLAAALVSFVVGDHHDPYVILAVVLINAVIGFMQEHQAARALEALKRMTSPKVTVLRDGQPHLLEARALVPGDVLVLEAGDHVGADARVLSSSELTVDESTLTGESVPVVKTHETLANGPMALGDRRNMVFMNTTVAGGRGRAVVVGTGMACEMGRIASAVASIGSETPLQIRLAGFSRGLGAVILGLIMLVMALGLLKGMALGEVVMMAIAMAVSGIPEGLPIVVTVLLALGVTRMARRQALIRRLPAVEALGAATVICTDKTGTLTRNEMTVEHVFIGGAWYSVDGTGYDPSGAVRPEAEAPEERRGLHWIAACARLCNNAALHEEAGLWTVVGDPMEGALLALAGKLGFDEAWERIDEVPFSSERKWMATLCRDADGLPTGLVKGAPDRVLELAGGWMDPAGQVRPWDPEAFARFDAAIARMAGEAMRVLALGILPGDRDRDTLRGDTLEGRVIVVGLVGLIDPERPEAVAAVARCHDAGIRVVMITGDHRATAVAIGAKVGIIPSGATGGLLEGAELERLSEAELADRVRDVNVFARVDPLHKLRIVRALQANGEVVAMTGDGVNDAPALRAADIGVAMGLTGTEVAKEAADMVLADDHFATIEAAVYEGRVIADNLRKVLQYLTSTCGGELLIVFAAILIGLPLPLVAVQFLWINLVTDGLFDKTLALEKGEPGIMTRPPIPPRSPLFSQAMAIRLVPIAVTMAVVTLGVFSWDLSRGQSLEHARTLAFTTMVAFQWFSAFAIRSFDRSLFSMGALGNRWMLIALLLGCALQLAAIFWPPLQSALHTVPLAPVELALAVGLASSILVVTELAKWFVAPRLRKWTP